MYDFKERQLGPNFAQDKLKDFKNLIDTGLSFVVLSMPGVGVSYFLKYLSTQQFAHFIHIDLYDLPILSQHEFYKLLLIELGGVPRDKTNETLLTESKQSLASLAQSRDKIVLIFSRFDALKDQFDWNFLSNIQSLTTVSSGNIVEIFTSTKPLSDIAPEALTGGNLNFFSENLYFKPYSKEDLKKLCQIEPNRPTSKTSFEHLLDLSGGHNQLLHILLSSQKQQNLLLDRFIKMQMKELVDYLDYHQRKTLQKIALGKAVTDLDGYLEGIGMVKKIGSHNNIFTPLLAEYIKTNLPVKLPVKEAKLFKVLKENTGETVSKDDIFSAVWGTTEKELENATDWALDALIYRLRKHPFIISNGYIIESHKKVGYTLIQA